MRESSSWVTRITVFPCRDNSLKMATISSACFLLTASVGSSARIISGSLIRARAIKSLRFSPPERQEGLVSESSSILKSERSFLALSITSFFFNRPSFERKAGRSTFSRTVRFSRKLCSWETKPMDLFLKEQISSSEREKISFPSMRIFPLSGF